MVFGFFKKEEVNPDLKWCEDLYFKFDREKQKEIEKFLNNYCFLYGPNINAEIDKRIKELEELDKQDDVKKEDVKRVKLILLILWNEAMRDIDEESARRVEKIKNNYLKKEITNRK